MLLEPLFALPSNAVQLPVFQTGKERGERSILTALPAQLLAEKGAE